MGGGLLKRELGVADSERPWIVRGVEAGHQDDGWADYCYAARAAPAADGGAAHAGELGPHYQPDRHVLVHWNQPSAEPGADREGARVSDRKWAHLDGGTEQPQHRLLCTQSGRRGAGRSVIGLE